MEQHTHTDSNSDRLVAFAEFFLSQPLVALTPPQLAVKSQGPVAHVVLFREGQYQVEMYLLMQPSSTFPPHRHPHVDTIEVDIAGELLFTVDGTRTPSNVTLLVLSAFGETRKRAVRIRPNQEHWVHVGEKGGAFLSIQQWIGREPSSVVLDWDGPAFSNLHNTNLQLIREEQK